MDILRSHAEEIKERFSIRSLRIFGFVARGEHQAGSDVDVCVEMAPNLSVNLPETVAGGTTGMLGGCRASQP